MTESTRDRAMRLVNEAADKDQAPLELGAWGGLAMSVEELETIIRLARNEALEEAAHKCECLPRRFRCSDGPNPDQIHLECSELVRAMKEDAP